MKCLPVVGDLNGDGFFDVVVGAPGSNAVHVFVGSSSGPASTPETVSPVTSGAFGASAAALGDVNDDGLDDVVVGAPQYNSADGRIYVYLGSTSART